MCDENDHPWLASVMSGALPFKWGLVDSSDRTDASAEEAMETDPNTWGGNVRRKLFRDMCILSATSVSPFQNLPRPALDLRLVSPHSPQSPRSYEPFLQLSALLSDLNPPSRRSSAPGKIISGPE